MRWHGPCLPYTTRVPRLAIAFPQKRELKGNIVVATGGTSDMAVAEEGGADRRGHGK